MHRNVCTAPGEKHRGERCFSSWLCLHFCVCSVQNRFLAIQVREVEWEDGAARPDFAGACTCRQGNRKVSFWKIWFNFYLDFPISWVFDVIFPFLQFLPPSFGYLLFFSPFFFPHYRGSWCHCPQQNEIKTVCLKLSSSFQSLTNDWSFKIVSGFKSQSKFMYTLYLLLFVQC